MSFRSSKRNSPSFMKEDPFEVTTIAFPSPNRDTQSYIEQTPDFRERSSRANRFRNDNFDPTSPIYFSNSRANSYDDDYKIFVPQSTPDFGRSGKRSPSINVKTPSLLELIDSYCDFVSANMPEAITFADFCSKVAKAKVEPIPKLVLKNFTCTDYYKSSKSFVEYMIGEINQMERELKDFEEMCRNDPPYLLYTFYQFQEKELSEIMKNVQGLMLIYSLEAQCFVEEQIFKLENIYLDELHKIQNLSKQYVITNKFMNKDVKFIKLNKYQNVQQNIDKYKEEINQNSKFKNFFLGINRFLSFKISKIEAGKIQICYPKIKETFTKNDIIKVHSMISNEQRRKNFQNEISLISKSLPYFRIEDKVVYFIFTKQNSIRFEVGFSFSLDSYPWTRICPKIRIIKGPESIIPMVQTVCSSQRFTKCPLKNICESIINRLEFVIH